ncbi:MAG: hypothetical protein PHE25_03705 [Candidatus Gracilibacteria bacterium]|nr:hypothetical protein [Candidatus Gracilibacteria bacterium]
MTESMNQREYETPTPEQKANEVGKALQNLSPKQTKNANNALQETSLAQKSQEKSQDTAPQLSEQNLTNELSGEKRNQLNQLSKTITQNVISQLQANFDVTNTDPNESFSIINQRYNVVEAIVNNPQIQAQYPQMVEALQEVVWINYNESTTEEQFARVTRLEEKMEKVGVYLNLDFAATHGEFCMEIKGEQSPDINTLGQLFDKKMIDGKLQPCIILGSDKEFNKKGYAFDGKTYLNPGAIENAIDIQVKNGRFTPQEQANFNLDNINLATINHEESHRLLAELYDFPQSGEDIPADQINDWVISGLSFQPQNYTQIDEFIAHSVGQSTDNYETIENIARGIAELNIDANGQIEYNQNPNSAGGKEYGLVRAFIMEEVAHIAQEKGVENFKGSLVNKCQNSDTHKYRNDYINTQKQLENAKQLPGNVEEVMHLANDFTDLKLKRPQIVEKSGQEWNKTTRDVIQLLGKDGLERINQRCMDQAKVYLEVIKNKFPKQTQNTS